MQLDIFESGSVIGTLKIGQEGLYKSVDAQCSPTREGVLRLYVWQGTQGVCLGVLCPENGAFTLRKRVSEASLPFAPTAAVVGREDAGYLPWRGEFDGAQIDHGYLKHTPEQEVLAVPFAEQMEYPFVHRLRQTETETICGELCLVLQAMPEASEEPPDAPENVDAKADDPAEEVAVTEPATAVEALSADAGTAWPVDAEDFGENNRFHPEV